MEYKDHKVVYRRYASLFFIVGVDSDEVLIIFIPCFCFWSELLLLYTHHTSFSLSLSLCVCVCVCVWERKKTRKREKRGCVSLGVGVGTGVLLSNSLQFLHWLGAEWIGHPGIHSCTCWNIWCIFWERGTYSLSVPHCLCLNSWVQKKIQMKLTHFLLSLFHMLCVLCTSLYHHRSISSPQNNHPHNHQPRKIDKRKYTHREIRKTR